MIKCTMCLISKRLISLVGDCLMKKKVLIMTQNFYPVIGSAGNRMKNIFQLLEENQVETHVLTTEPAYPNKKLYANEEFWDEESLNKETNKILRVPLKNKTTSNHILYRLLFYLEIMFRFTVTLFQLRKERYDYIYVSTPPIFIVFSAFIGRFFTRSKIILEVRDLWPDSLVGVKTFNYKMVISFLRFLEKRMYHAAEYIVINSKGFEEHIKEKLGKKSTSIIYLPNGPRQQETVEEKRYDEDFRVIYTGNIGLAQDISRLKQIAKLLHENGIHFDVIGYGVKSEEFRQYIQTNALTQVHLFKPTTRKNSLNRIANSHIAIAFLNEEEVFSTVLPGKIIDYMTCKTPIIAGVRGTAASIISDNQAGYTFDSREISEMVAKIVELKDQQKELERLGSNGLNTVKENFLWEHNIQRLLEILK